MESGLWLNPKWPYMGASPDGIVTCDCHGTGICEIKVILRFIINMEKTCLICKIIISLSYKDRELWKVITVFFFFYCHFCARLGSIRQTLDCIRISEIKIIVSTLRLDQLSFV